MDDVKALHEELLKTVETGLTPLREQIDAETKKRGEETAETKAAWERANDAISDLEAKLAKMSDAIDRRPSTDEPSAERKAFVGWLRKGNVSADEQKALSVANDPSGGYLAPTEYVNDIIKGVQLISPIRQIAAVRRTSQRSVTIPKRTGTFAAQWVGEQATRTETTGAAVGVEEIPVHEMYALVDVSNQDLEDSMFDLEAYLNNEFAEQFAKAEGLAFVTGNAVAKPEGLLTASGVSTVNSGSSGAFTADGVLNLSAALKTAYTANGTWLVNRAGLYAIRKLKDTTNQYLWQPGLAGTNPATIDEMPYVEVPDMPAAAAASKSLALGDFKRAYQIVDRIEMAVQRDPFTQANVGNTRFLARKRVGGQVVLAEALVVQVLS